MNPPVLTACEFAAFFRDLWNYDPFPWQSEFARRICSGEWPGYVTVPTGSGKTACLDAAVFALAVQARLPATERTQGRRIFFIVNRRIIVDEAYERAGTICEKLAHASSESILGRVAAGLRKLAPDSGTFPLARVQLRGGIYRERSWVRSLLQPMIICSTVDQAGSRLLFRGYGVSPQARPIHAALVAQDSLLIIDEAHISKPFLQTLAWVRRYRLYEPVESETVKLPFQVIQMTATPPADVSDNEKIILTEADYAHPVLKPRLVSAKPATLMIEEKAKGKAPEEQMAKRLTKEAEDILATHKPNSIAIMVNRVKTARMIFDALTKEHGNRVRLLIGRLRPIDRETLTKDIQVRLKTGAASADTDIAPIIVVSTQCLEVGADLDFDALVTEAASLDALRQRFGRLNRAGREIIPRAAVVLPGNQDLAADKLDEESPSDPIYGNAIPCAWKWLRGIAQDGVVDFGINAMTSAVDALRAADPVEDIFSSMLSPTDNAPVLLPAYLDCWVQTNPAPAADPDVAIFLHGPKRETAEVQVCWRADLPAELDGRAWPDTLSLCPPAAIECLPVPLHIFRQWMDSQGRFDDSSSDVDEIVEMPDRKKDAKGRNIEALIWRGPDKSAFAKSTDIRPGDTIVLRAQSGGWDVLGHLPQAPVDPQNKPEISISDADLRVVDVAEQAAAQARRQAVFRVHPALWPSAGKGTAAYDLQELSRDREADWSSAAIKALLRRLLREEESDWSLSSGQRAVIDHIVGNPKVKVDAYPVNAGFVISSRVLMSFDSNTEAGSEDSDVDPDALLEAAEKQKLCDHTQDVLALVASAFPLLPLSTFSDALIAATNLHDWGKVDPRFQALLSSMSPFAAMASGVIFAKSASMTSSSADWRAARERSELPRGFRHEMLSVQMAESLVGETELPKKPLSRALVLHLIAAHHGYGRPFAPFVEDETPLDASHPIKGKTVLVTSAERLEHPPHALDSGIAERFWTLTRHHGWWGLAFLEAILRVADQTASAHPQTFSKL